MGFPVVLKIVSPEILHKTEAGGVLVGVKSAEEAQKGYDTIIANAKKYNAKANMLGVQVQQMLAGGQEVIIGAVTDPVFGKLVAFGLGGVLVEVLKDITFRLAPATQDDALSMLDGIAAAQILKGVRGADPVNRDALATMIQNVSQLIADYPEIAEMDLNPVFATKDGAIAADVRIVVNFSPAPARFRPKHEDIVRDMNRIMKPKAVAVIGASSEAGKIGNSVMKNLINGGYKGQIYPINPSADEIMGLKAYKSVKDVPGDIDVAVFAIPAKFVAAAIAECGEKKIPGAVLIPSGFAESRQRRGAAGDSSQVGRKYGVRLMGPNIYGFYYTWSNLCATFCTALRRQGPRGAVVAVGRHRDGHHRLLPLGEDGRLGHRRSGNKVGHRRGRSADVLRAGRQHAHHRAALRGPEGRPRVRRSGQARVEEEAGRRAQGRTHLPGLQGGQLAHRRARGQRQDLRRCAPAVGRHSCALAARDARVRTRASDPADTEGRQHRHHHRRGRLRRAAVRRGRGQRPVAHEPFRRTSTRRSRSSSRRSARPATRSTSPAASRRRPTRTRCGSGSRIRGSTRSSSATGTRSSRRRWCSRSCWPRSSRKCEAKGIDKPVVVSLAGDVEVEEASEYLFDHKIPAYPYSTEIPVDVLGASIQWARGAGLL
mgnify:CR=1 FL=1